MKDIIVIGGGGHAKVVISILKKNNYDILGYTDIEDNGKILGIPYFGTDLEIIKSNNNILLGLGFGQLDNVSYRKKIVQKFVSKGYSFETIVSPNSVISEDVKIGTGTVIMNGVIINSGTKIGNYSIVNTSSSIDHDCKIGNYSHVAPGATMSGGVKIGNYTLIGVGATIKELTNIGSNSIIGAGSVVTKDIPDNVVAFGNPCKIIRENKRLKISIRG